MEKHLLHIKNPELQTSPEVNRAVQRYEFRANARNKKFENLRKNGHHGPLEREKIPNDPAHRIEAYMDRLENVFLNSDERTRERNLEMFREKIYDALIIKPENFPESYFELQKRIARERGQEVTEIPEHVREQMMATAIEDQRASLDAWIDYLASEDAVYPAWFKYFVWKNITKLSQFDKERGEFKQRTASTVAPYPDIYREPLAQIADIYEKVKTDSKNLKEPELREAFSKKFPSLYAELISKSLATSMESREEIRGQWVKYNQGKNGDAEKLFTSLEGKGTGWCTAGRSTAKVQIGSGDFYVYYTNDSSGNPTQPRLAIRMNGNNQIGEVRGILPHQGVEPIMQEVLDGKLQEFGKEADTYRKKSRDMRMLTALEKKRERGEPFAKEDLLLLYEVSEKIEGFGYARDPRIAELRRGRNIEEDMLVVFECAKDEIAHVPNQINERTKAYVGQIEPGVFQSMPEGIEHIYASFPDKKIRKENVEIGGRDFKKFFAELKQKDIRINFESWQDVERALGEIQQRNIEVSARCVKFLQELVAGQINILNYAKSMVENDDCASSEQSEEMTFVRLTVADLGFTTNATTDALYARAKKLGLELCPPDTGIHYRLKYLNQPFNELVRIGMKPIAGLDGSPSVFGLGRNDDGLWLRSGWAGPEGEWIPADEFVFRLRK